MSSSWRKSTRSSQTDSCVEVRGTLDALRDSKDPNGRSLRFVGPGAMTALVVAIRRGRFTR